MSTFSDRPWWASQHRHHGTRGGGGSNLQYTPVPAMNYQLTLSFTGVFFCFVLLSWFVCKVFCVDFGYSLFGYVYCLWVVVYACAVSSELLGYCAGCA